MAPPIERREEKQMVALLKVEVESGVARNISSCGNYVDQRAIEAVLPSKVADADKAFDIKWTWIANLDGERFFADPDRQQQFQRSLAPVGIGLQTVAIAVAPSDMDAAIVWVLT